MDGRFIQSAHLVIRAVDTTYSTLMEVWLCEDCGALVAEALRDRHNRAHDLRLERQP
jgi:hypothetical protein